MRRSFFGMPPWYWTSTAIAYAIGFGLLLGIGYALGWSGMP